MGRADRYRTRKLGDPKAAVIRLVRAIDLPGGGPPVRPAKWAFAGFHGNPGSVPYSSIAGWPCFQTSHDMKRLMSAPLAKCISPMIVVGVSTGMCWFLRGPSAVTKRVDVADDVSPRTLSTGPRRLMRAFRYSGPTSK